MTFDTCMFTQPCFVTFTDCGQVDDIENANVPDLTRGTLDQSVATYSCIEGYSLEVEENNALTCNVNNDGLWDGTMPVCLRGMMIFLFFIFTLFPLFPVIYYVLVI